MTHAKLMTKKTDLDPNEKIAIFYFDCDNEKITIQDDSDLQFAYATAHQLDKKVKFQIEYPNLLKKSLLASTK